MLTFGKHFAVPRYNIEKVVRNITNHKIFVFEYLFLFLLQLITDSKKGTAKFNANLPSLLSFLTDDQRVEMSYAWNDTLGDATYEGKTLDLQSVPHCF